MTDQNKNINRFETLYRKYQDNTISEDELNELLELSTLDEAREWIDGPLSEKWKEIESDYPISVSVPDRRVRRRAILRTIGWSVAAAMALLIAASIWWVNRDLGWEEYRTGNGETLEVVLSDQSRILLNANSVIRWKADWQKAGKRLIELKGEAFFDITHMEEVPLNVESANAIVRVLGTSFNVREDALGTEVYLYEGKVELDLNPGESDSTSLLMTSGDWVTQTTGKSLLKTQGVTKKEAASWTEGELIFRDQPLGEILTRLGAIYGKQFEVEDAEMLTIPMNVGVPYANWEVMKSALELSLSVELEENGQTVKLKK